MAKNRSREAFATCLDEYARQYAADPTKFDSIVDADGKPIERYGERVMMHLERIATELGTDLFPLSLESRAANRKSLAEALRKRDQC